MSTAIRLCILIVALATRLAVPSGFMIAPDQAMALVACPQTVAMEPRVAADNGHGDHHADPSKSVDPAAHTPAPCPYAAMSAALVAPAPAVDIVATAAPRAILASPPLPTLRPPPAAAPPPPSRAPPSAV